MERIEKNAIGEMQVRMDIEAGEGEAINKDISSAGIKLTKDIIDLNKFNIATRI